MPVNTFVSDVLTRKNLGIEAQQAPLWIMLNFFSAVFAALELYYGSQLLALVLDLPVSLLWNVELAVLVVNCLNLLVHLWHYLYPGMGYQVVALNETQKRLLTVNKGVPAIGSTPVPSPSGGGGSGPTTPGDLSALSWLSRSDTSIHSGALSTSAASWSYQDGSLNSSSHHFSPYQRYSPVSPVVSGPMLSSPLVPSAGTVDPRVSTPLHPQPNLDLTNERSLLDYISQCEEMGKQFNTSGNISADGSARLNLSQSMWNRSRSMLGEFAYGSPKLPAYQLSTRAPEEGQDGGDRDKKSDGGLTTGHHRTWVKLNVDQETLFRWTENLRIWLCETIFVRLAKEIDSVNAALKRHGLSDVQIGEVGLDKLRKTSQLVMGVPSLTAILPFLSASTHQEYLVCRIRVLSRGGCMQEFRWNSGGTFKDKPWEEHLPTDSSIVMHLFGAYLDARLPAHPSHPDGRTFTNLHVCRAPDTPSPAAGADRLIIHQSEITPPHFRLVVGDETLEVSKGRNNLFHTLLLFLYMIREKHDSMLDKIHIGPSGLNILWVIE